MNTRSLTGDEMLEVQQRCLDRARKCIEEFGYLFFKQIPSVLLFGPHLPNELSIPAHVASFLSVVRAIVLTPCIVLAYTEATSERTVYRIR